MAGGIRSYSTTPANNNASPPFGWPEGQPPSSVNNAARQMMADIRAGFEDLPWFDFGDVPTRVDNDTITVPTDLTARYVAGRRVKFVGATTGYATISSSSYSAPDTTINVTMDSGNVPATLVTVSLGPEISTGAAVPYFARTSAELAAGVTPTNYAYFPGHLYRYITNAVPGTTDLTTGFVASVAQAKQPTGAPAYWPAGTLLLSTVTLDGSNYVVKTEGFRTLLQQKSGQPDDTQIVVITGQNITFALEGCAFQGNIATDASEFHHCVYIYDKAQAGVTIRNIRTGDLYGTNIRGDVCYVGGTLVSPVYGTQIGWVSGANVFRDLVSVTGGEAQIQGIVNPGLGVGYRDFDSETNVGSQESTVVIGYLRGGTIQLAGVNTTYVSGTTKISLMDMDLSLVVNSTPGFGSFPGTNSFAILATTFRALTVDFLKMRGYNYAPVGFGASALKGRASFGHVDAALCDQTETTYNALFIDIGGGGLASLEINSITAALVAPVTGNIRGVFVGANSIVRIKNGTITGGQICAFVNNGEFEGLVIDCSTTAALIFNSVNNCLIKSCTLANAGSATLLRSAIGCTVENFAAATVGTLEGAGCAENRYINSTINGVKYTFDSPNSFLITKAMADANQTLSALESTAQLIRTTGALTAQRNLVVNAVQRVYNIDNTCTGFGVQVIAASGTGTVVALGKKASVAFDGTNVVRLTPDT